MNKKEIERLRGFFLEASRWGYASGNRPVEVHNPLIPGAKGYFYQTPINGRMHEYADVYFDAGHGKSFGFTIIAIHGEPVWTMRYNGESKEKYVDRQKITDVLKKALLAAYNKKRFRGGRGEEIFVDGNLQYENHGQAKNLIFENFSGGETISDISIPHKPEIVFFHKFEGGLVE